MSFERLEYEGFLRAIGEEPLGSVEGKSATTIMRERGRFNQWLGYAMARDGKPRPNFRPTEEIRTINLGTQVIEIPTAAARRRAVEMEQGWDMYHAQGQAV